MGARRPWSGLVLQAGDLRPLRDRPLPLRDSDPVNTVGEPYSGKPNVRFDEGRLGRAGPKPAAYSTTRGGRDADLAPPPRLNPSEGWKWRQFHRIPPRRRARRLDWEGWTTLPRARFAIPGGSG